MQEVTTPAQQTQLRELLKGQADKSYLATYFVDITVVEALQVLTLLQVKVFENEHRIWGKSDFKHRNFMPDF